MILIKIIGLAILLIIIYFAAGSTYLNIFERKHERNVSLRNK